MKESTVYLDIAVLEQTLAPLGGITPESLAPFVEIYIDESRQLFEDIQTAIQQQQADQIHYAAHTLKSSSAALGMMLVQNLCQHLETKSQNGDVTLAEYIPQLETAIQEGLKQLERLISNDSYKPQ
ncbi:MAG: Hpt domain-containing protein [Cyanobacteria bacterium P01_D01_bin.156]